MPENELKEIQKAIRETKSDLNEQLRYLQKEARRREQILKKHEGAAISKAELSKQFKSLKKRLSKKKS